MLAITVEDYERIVDTAENEVNWWWKATRDRRKRAEAAVGVVLNTLDIRLIETPS